MSTTLNLQANVVYILVCFLYQILVRMSSVFEKNSKFSENIYDILSRNTYSYIPLNFMICTN